MPRPGPRRELVAVRMLPTAIEYLDQRALDEGFAKTSPAGEVTAQRSEIVRLMLAYAKQHMPVGWRPR